MSKLSRLISLGNHEPELLRRIKELSMSIGFTETIFVGKAGDNSDGSSWAQAYTSLTTALDWIENNQATGELHDIILGPGTWDLNLTGVPTYTKNIVIYGTHSEEQVIISNTHATATGVLKFTGYCSVHNVTIDCGTGEIGIELEGTGVIGSVLSDLHFDCAALAGAADGILIDGGASQILLSGIHIDGETTNTSGIRLNNANDILVRDVFIHDALVSIHLDNAGDDNNRFEHCHIHSCITGILIDAGATHNHFDNVLFEDNTTRINDNGTTTEFTDIFISQTTIIAPDDVAGVLIVSAAGANAWTVAAVQIRAASATPFRIVGIRYECAVAEKTGIRLFSDGGTDPIFQDLVETGAAVAGKLEPSQPEPIWVNQGLAIHAKVKSEAGGNNVLIWLQIQIV